jgi:hypothetical protein
MSLTSPQRACVFVGVLLLTLATIGVYTEPPGRPAAVAFIGLCWLLASRLLWSDRTTR